MQNVDIQDLIEGKVLVDEKKKALNIYTVPTQKKNIVEKYLGKWYTSIISAYFYIYNRLIQWKSFNGKLSLPRRS